MSILAQGASSACDATVTSVGAWVPEASTGLYIEAESGELSGGFVTTDDPSASGGQCIEPPEGSASTDEPGSARVRYTISITTTGLYVIWGRIHSPDASHNTFWFQLDGGRWYLWRITTGEVWYWNAFHDNFDYGTALTFELDAGQHELVLANSVDKNRLDRLYLTADGDTPPGDDTPCQPPHSVQMDGGCIRSCGSLLGTACGAAQCQGRPTLPAYDCDICCMSP